MPCALLLFFHSHPAATAGCGSCSLWATGLLLLLSTADLCVSHLYLPLIFISRSLHLPPREALLLPSYYDYVSCNISAPCSLPLYVCVRVWPCVRVCYANGDFVRPHACTDTVCVIYHVATNAVWRVCLRVSDDVLPRVNFSQTITPAKR